MIVNIERHGRNGKGSTDSIMKPKRIQRKRTKGWRMPEGAVYVGRGSRWGNPFVVSTDHEAGYVVCMEKGLIAVASQADAVASYAAWLTTLDGAQVAQDAMRLLAGIDLACWCPLDQPCHAEVLLELANPSWRR